MWFRILVRFLASSHTHCAYIYYYVYLYEGALLSIALFRGLWLRGCANKCSVTLNRDPRTLGGRQNWRGSPRAWEIGGIRIRRGLVIVPFLAHKLCSRSVLRESACLNTYLPTFRAGKQSDDGVSVFVGYTPSPFRWICLCACNETAKSIETIGLPRYRKEGLIIINRIATRFEARKHYKKNIGWKLITN